MLFSESPALYSADQVAELDRLIIQHEGIGAHILMKRAGRAAFELLLERWPETRALHIFCGSGNNAGDGYIVAALAKQRNLDVVLWSLVEPDELEDRLDGAALLAYQYAKQEGVESVLFDEAAFYDSQLMQNPNTLLVDALLGTGVKGELRGAYKEVVAAINQAKHHCLWPVLALDIPSGVNPNTGAVASIAVEASVTISFIGQKQGLLTGAGRVHSGDRYFSDLEVDDEWLHLVNPSCHLLDIEQALLALPDRALDAHKGSCGHLLVIGGDLGVSYGYGGAPIMAAQMALRTGAGLVSLATRAEFVAPALARQPEMMLAAIDNGQALLPLLERASGIVIGPGLGRSSWSEQLLYQVLDTVKAPLVLDADALHLLADPRFETLSSVAVSERQWILTPHPGEAASLLGEDIATIEADRLGAAMRIQQRYGGAVILKGAGSVVACANGETYICDAGNPAMASGGMGDVLSGLLGSLLVQGLSCDDAAKLGCILHSSAADIAVGEQGVRGLLATDLIGCVQGLLNG